MEESLAGERQASATARRHDISPSLLYKWRQLYREGLLSGSAIPAFIPAQIIAAEMAAAGSPPSSLPGGGRMEIVLAETRRIIVGADVDAPALGRVLDALERR